MQGLCLSKVNYQKTIVVIFRKISENETPGSHHCAIDSASALLGKARIFPPQFQKIEMEIVELAILFSFGEIKFTANKCLWVIRCGQSSACFFFG